MKQEEDDETMASMRSFHLDTNKLELQQVAFVNERLKLDRLLLESLIKLIVCEQELADNSHSIAELTYHPLYYTGTLVFLLILGTQFNLAGSNLPRIFSCTTIWTNFNLVVMTCALIYSRIVELERIMLFILAPYVPILGAHLTSDQRDAAKVGRRKQAYDNVRPCSFAADMWLKFVYATSSDIKRYCSCPLGVQLTYEKMIEINFFIVFIYSLSIGRG